jgi:hypothetical protein
MREVRAAPKQEMVSVWEGLTVGKNSNDGCRKRAGVGRGGSVAGVDERRVAWPCTEESEGGKRRGEHGGVGRLFEAEAARQRRGVRGDGRRVEDETGERGKEGPGAAGNSSGGRHRPLVGGRGQRRWRATVEGDRMRAARTQAADGWDRATTGPGG